MSDTYSQSGVLPPGSSRVTNATGQPEPVLDGIVDLPPDAPPSSGRFADPHPDLTDEEAELGERLGQQINVDDDDDNGGLPRG